MSLKESEKRDFVHHIINDVEQNSTTLQKKGFDPKQKLTELKQFSQDADEAEAIQLKVHAEAMKATQQANEKLDVAYREASAMVELIAGLLGKDDDLVRKLKQIRN